MNKATRFFLREFFYNKNTPDWMTRSPQRLVLAGIVELFLGIVCWAVAENNIPGALMRGLGAMVFIQAAGYFVRAFQGEERVGEIQSELDQWTGKDRR